MEKNGGKNVSDGMTECYGMGPSREEASRPISDEKESVGGEDARAKRAEKDAVVNVKTTKSGGGIDEWMGRRGR